MGKTITEEGDLNGLERKLLEKKKLLSGQPNNTPHDGNGINHKKLTREEKDKIQRALKKKRRKQKKRDAKGDANGEDSADEEEIKREAVPKPDIDLNVEVEYVEKDEYLLTGKYYEEFKHVFQYFSNPKQPLNIGQDEDQDQDEEGAEEAKPEEGDQPLSRKKKKMLKRLKVAQLKAQVRRPDVVEVSLFKLPVVKILIRSGTPLLKIP